MHSTNLHTLIFMSATADMAMGGGFQRNTVSKLKHRWGTQTQKQLNKNHAGTVNVIHKKNTANSLITKAFWP